MRFCIILILIIIVTYYVYKNTKETFIYTPELMNEVLKRNDIFVNYLRKKYTNDIKWGKHVKFLVNNYDKERVTENFPYKGNYEDTSYVVGKGSEIVFCLRNITDNGYPPVDINTMMYVSIHELTHIFQYSEYGHEYSFFKLFKWMLNRAIECGVYVPENYSKKPVSYCGMTLKENVYFDEEFKSIK